MEYSFAVGEKKSVCVVVGVGGGVANEKSVEFFFLEIRRVWSWNWNPVDRACIRRPICSAEMGRKICEAPGCNPAAARAEDSRKMDETWRATQADDAVQACEN